MEKRSGNISEETAKALDNFIMAYYKDGLMDDFRRLTPAQRVGIFIRCAGLRLPKFKAIELNDNGALTMRSIVEALGKVLQPAATSPQ